MLPRKLFSPEMPEGSCLSENRTGKAQGIHDLLRSQPKHQSQDANGSGAYMDFAALLTLKGAKIDGGSVASLTFNPYYLEVPVRVGYKYAVNDDFALFGSVGPYVAVGLFGKMKAKVDGDIADIAGLDGNSASEDIFGDDGLKRFDFGLGLKAGVEFSKKYQVAISYDFGLVEVAKDLGMKNRNLMISLGYMF